MLALAWTQASRAFAADPVPPVGPSVAPPATAAGEPTPAAPPPPVTAPGAAASESFAPGGGPAAARAVAAGGCSVTLVPERSILTLGVDTDVRVDLTLSGCDRTGARAGRVQATVGVLDPLIPGGAPGAFTSFYHVPRERFPQTALLAAEVALPSGARVSATAVISLPATTTFPFRTEPQASVTLEVAGHAFGPVTASVAGMVAIPIVVPPGVDRGRAVAIGRFGGEKDMEVNMQTRDYPRVLLVAPMDAEAGGAMEVAVWALDPSGAAAVPEDIDLRTSLGAVRRTGGAAGVARFVVTPPRDAADGALQLTASMSDGTSERAEAVSLHPGPAAVLVVTSSLPQLVVGSSEVATIEISALDRWDNDANITGVTVTVDDRPLPVEGDASAVTGHIAAPATWSGHEKTVIDARLGNAETRREVLITGGAPANVRVSASRTRVVADGHTALDLVAEVSDRRGTPTSTSRIVWTTTDDGLLVAEPPPRFGAYAARFSPNPALHDRRAIIDTVVDPDLHASQPIDIETPPARTATARVGLISNFGGLFGQTAFLEASIPYPAQHGLLRLFSVSLAVGYIHGETTTNANMSGNLSALQTEVNQFPLLGALRMHIPAQWPVEVTASGLIGVTWLASSITDLSTGLGISSGSSGGFVLGLGGDVAFPLRPGEFVVGARYLSVSVGNLSNGDRLVGNAGGLVADLGFRLRL